MKLTELKNRLWPHIKAHPILSALAGLVLLSMLIILLGAPRGSATQTSSTFEVRRGGFLISIVEGGALEAVNEVVVRNEVEGTARIIYIVPEASYVQRGDLLVELDSAQAQDQVNQQEINFAKAEFALLQAEQQLEIQRSIVESETQAAELKVEFARKDLEKYLQGESQQERRNTQIEITNVLENLRIAEERLEWSEELFAQGFETKGNLDRDRLAVSQSRLRLEQAETALHMFETFDYPKKRRQLEANLKEAEDALERTRLQGERRLAQYEADAQTQRSTLALSRNKLQRDRQQLIATKIYAPAGGLVVYASGGRYSSDALIEEGATVRNRQELIKLPDVSAMRVNVKIHEAYVNQVRPGQAAFVVLDAMPDRRFAARVDYVALLPDSQSRWMNPNLKIYATHVRVLDPLPDVKPGVSARAEIVITNVPNALTLPIQAVTTRGGQQVVYRAGNPPVPVPVTVGLYNSRMIEITSGLEDGARVLLAPPFDFQEKDLGGHIIAKGDTLPDVSNAPPLPRGNGIAPREGAGTGGEGDRPGQRPRGAEGEVSGTGQPRTGEGAPAGREDMLRRFDSDGDGQLSEAERAAMREYMNSRRSRTNTPPAAL